MTKAKRRVSLTDVESAYIENCLAYADKRRQPDYVGGNKFATKASKACALLRHEYGLEGRLVLAKYMQHEDSIVRSVTAANNLDIFTDEAIKILQEVEKLGGMEGHSAHYALKLWFDGGKEFPGGRVE